MPEHATGSRAAKRHAYWIRPGLLRHLHGHVVAVTFGVGRLWIRSTVGTKAPTLDIYWPRFKRFGRG